MLFSCIFGLAAVQAADSGMICLELEMPEPLLEKKVASHVTKLR